MSLQGGRSGSRRQAALGDLIHVQFVALATKSGSARQVQLRQFEADAITEALQPTPYCLPQESMFGGEPSGITLLLALPIVLQEMVLAVRLVAKGFIPPGIASSCVRVDKVSPGSA
jgi:hypothetical protein